MPIIPNSPTPRALPRMLVIDDERQIAELVVHIADECGFAAEAIYDLEDLTPERLAGIDVLVTDLVMPRVDGIEIVRMLGSSKSAAQVVLMSGLDRRMLESARKVADAYGVRVLDVVQKPFRSADLKAIFRKITTADIADERSPAYGARPDLTIEDFAAALERDELVVYLQPQIRIVDDALVGFEALARWQHPVHGLLFPDAFVPLAENSHLALPFCDAILRSAVRDWRRIVDRFQFKGTLSVNVPPSALTDVNFPERVTEILAAAGMDHSRLILEVTETSIPNDLTVSLDIQTRLGMRGIKLSIDDFGTGHSSLERLRDSPFNELKVDRVFVNELAQGSSSISIVENAIALGHSLDMAVVAEGVEDQAAFDALKALQCDVAQGYLIARPMSLADALAWMEKRHPASPVEPVMPAAAPLPAATAQKRVLVVEDNLTTSEMIQEYLSLHGYAVRAAFNGRQALDAIAREQPDIVLMDIQMPEMDGFEAMRRIRSDPALATMPILAVTALASRAQTDECLAAGANDYLSKPMRMKELLTRMNRLLATPNPAVPT